LISHRYIGTRYVPNRIDFDQCKPLFESPSEPPFGLLSELPSELPSEPLIEPLSELLFKSLNKLLFELTLDEDIGSLEKFNNYQYNFTVRDSFDNWLSVNIFIHQYYLKHDFGYQIFQNNKDPHDSTVI
jgi:hypothetical protein